MFICISIGSNRDPSLSSVRHRATNSRTNAAQVNEFNSTLRENGSEGVEAINFSLRALRMLKCAKFESQWDLPLSE